MKVIHYKYYFYPVFDCVIEGKIKMTQDEWNKEKKYLLKTPKIDSYFKKILKDDIKRRIETKNSFLINIRTTATGLIAERNGLDRYTRKNYVLEIEK